MTPIDRSDPTEEQAALVAAGAATPEEMAAFEPLLADLTSLTGLAGFGPVVNELAHAIPALNPPVAAKAKLFARLMDRSDPRAADRAAASGMAGFVFRFGEDGEFAPTPYPGVWARMLHVDTARSQFSVILKMDPGSVYPSHAHDGPEECVVLDGEISVGNVRMRRGDYQRAEPGSDHIEQRTETGALLFITAPLSLLET